MLIAWTIKSLGRNIKLLPHVLPYQLVRYAKIKDKMMFTVWGLNSKLEDHILGQGIQAVGNRERRRLRREDVVPDVSHSGWLICIHCRYLRWFRGGDIEFLDGLRRSQKLP